jgi:predicted ATPase/DNA-binding SARP family transcriptional activator
MPRLEIRLFGPPEITVDGANISLDTRKAIALLAYLTVNSSTGQPRHRRDALATLLWPDADQTHARSLLRRTLFSLTHAIPPATLEVGRETIALRSEQPLWIDVQAFEAAIKECRRHDHGEQTVCPHCLPPLRRAADLYRGDFMAGFTLRDSANFDDWQFFQAEDFRRQAAHVFERLVQGLMAQQDYMTAVSYARRWLQLDPLHEPAHRALMQLYAWSGQTSAALRQYRECMRILDEELGAPPLPETTEIFQAISENRYPAPDPASQPAPQPLPAALVKRQLVSVTASPLVGRQQEWDALLAAYGSIQDGGRLIVLEGEAGIGKSYLADAFLAQVRLQGATTCAATCYEGESALAYAPIIEALRQAFALPQTDVRLAGLAPQWLAEAARLVAELTVLFPQLPPLPPADGVGAHSRFLEGVTRVLAALLAGPAPGLLFIDDLHWADTASVELLAYLVRRLRSYPISILVAWRGAATAPPAQLQQLLADAQRNHTATLIHLGRWERNEVQLYATQAPLPTEFPGALVDRLFRETEGLPLLVAEYVTMVADGELGLDAIWQIPPTVRDLFQARLSGLDQVAAQVLGAAAVIGRSFDFDTVRAAGGRSEDETVTALEELLQHNLVHEVPPAHHDSVVYDFVHERLRALAYDEMSQARRRLLHGRVADALHQQVRRAGSNPGSNSSAVAAQLAYHAERAGRTAEAAEAYILAGERARQVFANHEALAHFQAALALGHPDRTNLLVAIGDLQTLVGEYRNALASYQQAAESSSDLNPVQIEYKLGRLYHRLGEWDAASAHFQKALDQASAAEAISLASAIRADWALTAYRQGDVGKAATLAVQALATAEAAADPLALAQAHNVLGILARNRGAAGQAIHHAEESLALTRRQEQIDAQIAALNNLGLAHLAASQPAQGIDLLEEALALCLRLGDRHREAALRNNLADLLHRAGHHKASMSQLKQAVTIFAQIGLDAGPENVEIWKLTDW